MSRPIRSRQIAIRIAEPLYDLLEEDAVDHETSVASVARRVLRDHSEHIAAQRLGTGAGTAGAAAA